MVHQNAPTCSVWIPTRFTIGVMIFTACLFSYMLRVNMSINLIAMVQPKIDTTTGKTTVPECIALRNETININVTKVAPDYGVRYNWDQKTQGLILGAYFWGYIFTGIPGGLLAEKWGPRKVIGCTGILAGLLTILTPVSASVHYGLVIADRFIMGLASGVLYPALHCLISRWVPPNEKGKFTFALLGGNFGTVITWPLLGTISEHLGWIWAFYIPGILCLSWVFLWYYLVSDTPEQHSRISEKERKYIEQNIGNTVVTKTMQTPPYKSIFTSVPFWALTVLHFGNTWGLSFLLTMGPKYLAEVLGFNLSSSGILAALPHLARIVMAFVFGSIGDVIRRKQLMTVTQVRKWFVICSHLLPGLLLVAQTVTGCDVTLAVILITLSLGLNGACTITNIQNNQDLAPNFAGTVYGIINCIGSSTGFITPILTGYLTQEKNGLAEWRLVFTIGAIVYITSGLIFCVFGSGEIQQWNTYEEKTEKPEDDPSKIQGHDNYAFTKSEYTNHLNDINHSSGNVIESTKI